MIELCRYARLKPQGLAWIEPAPEGDGITVCFKRFDPEDGKEVAPERSFLLFKDIEIFLSEIESQAPVAREILRKRNGGPEKT